jgi:sulfite exporter TauE/SafE
MDYWTAFVLGLFGSLHCAGMCGPLALAMPHSSVPGRLAYNFGRIVTYCLLGAVFGLFGQALLLAGVQRWTSIVLGAALLAGLFTARRLTAWIPITSAVARLKRGISALLRRGTLPSQTTLGMLNGLLPCGLVYVACAGAVTTGSVLSGGFYMMAFGLGTVPMLLVIGFSSRLISVPLRLKLARAIPVSVFLLGTLLILRGMSLGIPYISPDISAAAPACCAH